MFVRERASPGLSARVREQVAILEDAISHVTAHDAFNKLAIFDHLGSSRNLRTFGQKPAALHEGKPQI